MKKYLFLLLAGLLFAQLAFSQIRSKVDERFELTSIMFALAGAPEYCQTSIPSYDQDIIELNDRYSLTEPIEYIRELNQVHRVAYNCVSTTADMMEIKDGVIRLQPQYDIANIAEADPRWNEELFAKYLVAVNDFYQLSNFHQFFEDHRELYALAEQRMDSLLGKTTTGWFESFYGKPFDPSLNVYLSLCNGPSNYMIPSGILIGMMANEEGEPNPEASMYTLLHEFGHHYTNPVFEAYWPQMKEAAEKIYPHVEKAMQRNAYPAASLTIGEWLNNLFVLMYYKEHVDPEMFDLQTNVNMRRGFIWMDRSVDFMENFYAHRDLYPHIEDFMPQLIGFLNYTADNMDIIVQEYEGSRPYITNVFPALGTDISGFEQIVVTFSEPMVTDTWGFNGSGNDDKRQVKDLYMTDLEWSDDGRQLILLLDTSEAEEGCLYNLQMVSQFFQSEKKLASMIDRHKNLFFNTIKKTNQQP